MDANLGKHVRHVRRVGKHAGRTLSSNLLLSKAFPNMLGKILLRHGHRTCIHHIWQTCSFCSPYMFNSEFAIHFFPQMLKIKISDLWADLTKKSRERGGKGKAASPLLHRAYKRIEKFWCKKNWNYFYFLNTDYKIFYNYHFPYL